MQQQLAIMMFGAPPPGFSPPSTPTPGFSTPPPSPGFSSPPPSAPPRFFQHPPGPRQQQVFRIGHFSQAPPPRSQHIPPLMSIKVKIPPGYSEPCAQMQKTSPKMTSSSTQTDSYQPTLTFPFPPPSFNPGSTYLTPATSPLPPASPTPTSSPASSPLSSPAPSVTSRPCSLSPERPGPRITTKIDNSKTPGQRSLEAAYRFQLAKSIDSSQDSTNGLYSPSSSSEESASNSETDATTDMDTDTFSDRSLDEEEIREIAREIVRLELRHRRVLWW